MSSIFTVREITRALRDAIEGTFPFVWVQGQVSNLTRPSSGHLYFTLKDEEASLQCVWFKGNQKDSTHFDPLTGEVFEQGPRVGLSKTLQNGQEVLCAGRLTVYAPRGGYQLVVELAQASGVGALHLAFEELKLRLMEKGYFALGRKRTLPFHPRRVAVVTAPRGAAIHDFLRIASERGCGAEIRIYPVPVQGDDAPPRIVAALQRIAHEQWAEITVLIRGGGSLEDLWAFNDERVADAIFSHRLPLLAGIGHEVDVTIADMTADVRAATPSHAAQLLWPERRELQQRLDETEIVLERAFNRLFDRYSLQLKTLEYRLAAHSPAQHFVRLAERFEDVEQRLVRAGMLGIEKQEQHLKQLISRLERSLSSQAMTIHNRTLEHLSLRLRSAMEQQVTTVEHDLERLSLRLEACNPLLPLQRGYSLVQSRKGEYIRSVHDVTIGDTMVIHLADGRVDTTVHSIQNAKENPQDSAKSAFLREKE